MPLYFSFALPLSVHSSSVSFYLPAFFTIIFSPSSRSDSFYLLSFFQNQLRDIIARRCAMRFPAKKSLLSPTPRVHADYFPLPGKSVRTDVRDVITKFSGMDSLPIFLIHGAPLRARFARGSSAMKRKYGKNYVLFPVWTCYGRIISSSKWLTLKHKNACVWHRTIQANILGNALRFETVFCEALV